MQSNHEANNYQEHEIDLKAAVSFFIERKFLILGLTACITVLAYLYSTTMMVTYQATLSVKSPSSIMITDINKLIYTSESKRSILSSFLTVVTSQDLQKNVFVENDFLTQFNKDNNPIENVDKFIENVISSIIINKPKLNVKEIGLYDVEDPYYISINGNNPEAISDYLKMLVSRADSKNTEDIIKLNHQKINIRLDEIKIESEMLLKKSKQDRLNLIKRIKEEDTQKIREINDQISREKYKAQEKRLNQILLLTESAKLANSLGIIENNFKLINATYPNPAFPLAIGERKELPVWYLFGEKALLQEIELLNKRTSDDPFVTELITLKNQLNQQKNNNLLKTLEARQDDSPFIPGLVALNLEVDKLESTNLNLSNTNSINFGAPQVTKTSRNKNIIVWAGFFVGLVLSILLALIMNALKPDEKASA